MFLPVTDSGSTLAPAGQSTAAGSKQIMRPSSSVSPAPLDDAPKPGWCRLASNSCMWKLAIACCLVAAIWNVGLQAQRGVNFSGEWVLDEGFRSSELVPQRLTVQQPTTATDASGAPMPAEYAALIVRRHFADGSRQDTYPIESVGGRPSLVPSRQTRLAAEWLGNSYLRLKHLVFSASGAAERTPRTETWRFDDGGRLVISLVITEPETSQVLAYRRDTSQEQ